MSKASENSLGELHGKLADVLTEVLTPVDEEITEVKTNEDGEEVVEKKTKRTYAGPAYFAVAAKFLKDNSIFVDPNTSDRLSALKDKLNRTVTKADMKDAMNSIGTDLLQ